MKLYKEDGRSIEEILNGEKGPEPGTEKQYSSDPDYYTIDPQLFQYLITQKKLNGGTRND